MERWLDFTKREKEYREENEDIKQRWQLKNSYVCSSNWETEENQYVEVRTIVQREILAYSYVILDNMIL